VIKKSQYHLDIRGGEFGEGGAEFVSVSEIGKKEFDEKNMEIAKILGLKYWLIGPYPKGTIKTEATHAGVQSLALMGYKGLGTYDEEDIEKCRRGIYNFMKYLKMIPGKPEIPTKPIRIAYEMTQLHAKHGGLMYLDVKYGDIVKKGQKVGEIRNLKGETIEVLIAPGDGVIHTTFPKHIKQPGELILDVRQLLE
jgi:predicted deacylase